MKKFMAMPKSVLQFYVAFAVISYVSNQLHVFSIIQAKLIICRKQIPNLNDTNVRK